MDKKSIKLTLILALILLGLGFFAGRWTIKPKIKIKYIKGETVHDSIPYEVLVPYKVEIPAKPNLPLKPDTILIPGEPEYITMKVDTAQIIAEFIKKNTYKQTLFDNDTLGRFTFNAVVQYNLLQGFNYDFTPVHKQIKITQRRLFIPFISTSYNSFGYVGTGAGFYYHDLGISLKYLTNFQEKGYELGFSYKF